MHLYSNVLLGKYSEINTHSYYFACSFNDNDLVNFLQTEVKDGIR